jgi:hypothetical protein
MNGVDKDGGGDIFRRFWPRDCSEKNTGAMPLKGVALRCLLSGTPTFN